jgi:hypothetical protein
MLVVANHKRSQKNTRSRGYLRGRDAIIEPYLVTGMASVGLRGSCGAALVFVGLLGMVY